MKTYQTTTVEIFTPTLDRFTMGKYQGNHFDLFISFNRKGDDLTVSQAWSRDSAGTFIFREERSYSISKMVQGLSKFAEENKYEFICNDNLPEGFSLAMPI